MRKITMTVVLATIAIITARAQKPNDEQAVREVITHFAQSADQQNEDILDDLLDANFRVVMNRLFGSSEVSVLTKDAYLGKIRNKEWGGEPRKIRIEDLTIMGNTAYAKVAFRGSQASFVSLLQFIKTKEAHWKLISDLPTLM